MLWSKSLITSRLHNLMIKNHPGLTVELQDGVVHLALDLACALERTGHPQSFVHGYGRDDVVPYISRHLPLGQNGANYQSNHTQKGQGESQNLQTRVGHVSTSSSSST